MAFKKLLYCFFILVFVLLIANKFSKLSVEKVGIDPLLPASNTINDSSNNENLTFSTNNTNNTTIKIIKNNNLLLFVIVPSAPENFSKRETIRKTWRTLLRGVNGDQENKFFRFVIGTSGLSKDVLQRIRKEEEEHSDMLLLHLHDSYHNLTLKSIRALKWALGAMQKTEGQYKFLLKCDDDSFINLKSLSQLLATYRTIKNFAVGSLIKRVKIENIPCENGVVEWCGKFRVWKENKNKNNNLKLNNTHDINMNNSNYKTVDYKTEKCGRSCVCCIKDYMEEVGDGLNDPHYLPAYLSGSAYVLSQEAVQNIVSIVPRCFPFVIEDVFITGFMTKKSLTYLHNSELFKIQRGISFDVCSRQISSHYIDEKAMMKIWSDYITSPCF